jgi:uncharacterized protein
VRPPAPTFADATGSTSCAIAQGRNEPFIVDWPADKRSDLDVALKQRIPVVAYDCNQLRLLTDCELEGSYKFIGVTEKEEVVRLEGTDELHANLPFSAFGRVGGAVDRGLVIDVAYAIVGKSSSSRAKVRAPELHGECAGATHFIRGMTLGAFAMKRNAHGTVGAAADFFGQGVASAQSSDSRNAESRDGDLSSCKSSSASAEGPPAQCGAAIKLELRAIEPAMAEGGAGPAKAVDPDSVPDLIPVACPAGLVPTDQDRCVHPSDGAPHLCTPHDPVDCDRQCSRGSAASCSLLARMLQLGDGIAKDPMRAVTLYAKACDAGTAPACGRLGEALLTSPKEPDGVSLLGKSCSSGWIRACTILGNHEVRAHGAKNVDVYAILRRACDAGDASGCWTLGQMFTEGLGVAKNEAEALRYYRASCEGDAKLGCSSYAQALDAGRGTAPDPAAAVKLLHGSCERGFSSSCDTLSLWYFQGHAVPRDLAKGVELLQRACDGTGSGSCLVLGQRYERGIDVPKDPKRALALYDAACTRGLEIACMAELNLRKRVAAEQP